MSRGHALPLAAGCESLNYPAGAVRTTLEQEGQLRSLSAYSSFVVTSGSVCSSSRQECTCAPVTREQGARARLFRRNSTARSLPTGFSTDLASERPPDLTRLSQTSSVSLPLCPANTASWAKPRSGSTQLFTFSASISQLLKHGWENLTPCRWCLYKLRSPMPSGPWLLLGSPSLFPCSACHPVYHFPNTRIPDLL